MVNSNFNSISNFVTNTLENMKPFIIMANKNGQGKKRYKENVLKFLKDFVGTVLGTALLTNTGNSVF